MFGKVMEPFGNGVLLKEVCYWGRTFRFYSLPLLPVDPLLHSYFQVPSWPHVPTLHTFLTLTESVTLKLSIKINAVCPELLYLGYFIPATEIKLDQRPFKNEVTTLLSLVRTVPLAPL